MNRIKELEFKARKYKELVQIASDYRWKELVEILWIAKWTASFLKEGTLTISIKKIQEYLLKLK